MSLISPPPGRVEFAELEQRARSVPWNISSPVLPGAGRSPEAMRFDLEVPARGWLDLAVGTVDPSFLTGLYPSTTGVFSFPDRLPASATTIAEAYQAAGYATVSFSPNGVIGLSSNMHQGTRSFTSRRRWWTAHRRIHPKPRVRTSSVPRSGSSNIATRRFSSMLNGRHTMATAARLKPDTEMTKTLSAEELQRLRSLGYVK